MDPKQNPAKTGGIWSDANLQQGLEWEGATIPAAPRPATTLPVATTPAAIGPPKAERTATPQSPESSGKSTTRPGEVKEIADRVVKVLTAQLGGEGVGFRAALQAIMAEQDKRTKEWVEARSESNSQLGATNTRLDEIMGRVDSLTASVASLVEMAATRNESENKVLEHAAALIRDQERGPSDRAAEIEKELAAAQDRRQQLEAVKEAVEPVATAGASGGRAPAATAKPKKRSGRSGRVY